MDHKEFSRIKHTLKNNKNISYVDFIKDLVPCYFKVWRDILFGYLAMALSLYVSMKFLQAGIPEVITIFFGALFVGFWFNYLLNFYHEAAHYNLCSSRKLNDALSNLFINSWIGTDIKNYRGVHFQHHTKHGTINDPERSYFNALSPTFIFKSLFMIHAIKTYFLHKNMQGNHNKIGRPKFQLFLGLSLHFLLTLLCWKLGGIPLVLVWVLGVCVFGFFFGILRQLLEHRSMKASRIVNYEEIDHGEENRMFGEGFFASTFGSAGFNRHLLHHFAPSLSYTNLKDVEKFLEQTSLKSFIDSKRTTYFKTFYGLLRWKKI